MEQTKQDIALKKLMDVYSSFSDEQNYEVLLQKILEGVMDNIGCDAGTLYIVEENKLHFKIIKTISKKVEITLTGTRTDNEMFPPVAMDGKYASAYCAMIGRTVNIEDVYSSGYDFAGTKEYDKRMGYRTKSMLIFPMKNERGEVIGVIQLINALEKGDAIAFETYYHNILEAFGVQAGICLNNIVLLRENAKLLESMVEVLTTAIDEFSTFNANHTQNMVLLAEKFVEWLRKNNKQLQFTEKEKNQLIMSIRLHDIGKLTTPLYILNKKTRLDGKMEMVFNRFEKLELYTKLAHHEDKITYATWEENLKILKEGKQLVFDMNMEEVISNENLDKLRFLGEKKFITFNDQLETVLKPDELDAITVKYGILTEKETTELAKHVEVTEKMLKKIQFNDDYSDVVQWASSHHEFLNGEGYPKGLIEKEIPMAVRVLSVVDSFESLVAQDRPNQKVTTPVDAIRILRNRVQAKELDAIVVELFAESGVWDVLEK